MTVQEFFIADGRVRPIWRFFIALLLMVGTIFLTGIILGIVFRIRPHHVSMILALAVQSVVIFVILLGVFKVMTAAFDRRPLASMGFAFHRRWIPELSIGLGVGAAMICLAVIPEWAFGYVRFTMNPQPFLAAGGVALAIFAIAAANEEMMFRGYPFQRLVESITPVGAIAVTSALFGAAHLYNPSRTFISTINTMLVGVPLAIAYLRTRSLWMPLGMHFIWNFLMDFLFGLPVSGLNLTNSVLKSEVHGPTWATGGSYGPEGGVLATVAILALTVYVAFAKSIYTTEEMKALVFAPAAPMHSELPLSITTTDIPAEGYKAD